MYPVIMNTALRLTFLILIFVCKINGEEESELKKEELRQNTNEEINYKANIINKIIRDKLVETPEKVDTPENSRIEAPIKMSLEITNLTQVPVQMPKPADGVLVDTPEIKVPAEIPNPTDVPLEIDAEECVGDAAFCNLTKEEYVRMLEEYIYPHNYEWALIVTHSIVFIIGLIGNALVCVAVYRNHTMRTVTNYFIVNLAVADFMVILICLPPTVLWDVTETWFLGAVLCKLLLYFQSVSVTVSVLTLTFIAVDRWYAICFPLEFKSTTGRAKTAIIIIWIASLAFNVPEFVVLTTVTAVPLRFDLQYLVQCTATWSPSSELVWHIMKVLFIYTIPLILMSIAYYQIVRVLWKTDNVPGQAESVKLASAEQTQLRSRRKAAKMLVAVVIMFAVCYFPVHLLSVLRYTLEMEQTDAITCLALISHVLCYANSAINPLIYNFMSGKFRREFKRSFCCSAEKSPESFTTLTRVTTSKLKRPPSSHQLITYDCRQQECPKNMDTSFIQGIEYKNGSMT